MLEFQYIECTFVNEVSNLARVRARKGPGCVPILWAASDIYNQTKTPTCSMFFLFYRTFAFFFFKHKKAQGEGEGGSTQFSLRHRRTLKLWLSPSAK